MATTWNKGPFRVCLGNKRGVIGTVTFDTGTAEEFASGLSRVESVAFSGNTSNDHTYSIARNTTTTTDNADDTPGTVDIAGIGAARYSVISAGK